MMRGHGPTLPSGAVVVEWRPTADGEAEAAGLLSISEQRRLSSYRVQADRDRFAVGAGLVRALAASQLGRAPHEVEIDRTCTHCGAAHGPPRVIGTDLRVSVSHAGRWVAVAATLGKAVGLDIEVADALTDRYEELAAIVLAADERCAPDRLTIRWTQKEAVLKATGQGLLLALTGLVIDDGPSGARVTRFDDPRWSACSWSLVELDAPTGVVATLAVIAKAPLEVHQRR